MNTEKDPNPLIQKRKEIFASIAPKMMDKYITEAVLSICDANEEPSREKIIKSLKASIEETLSSLKETQKDLDVIRVALDYAILRIESTYQKDE